MRQDYFAVAITRTCGSGGGSYVGRKLADDYGIDFYDRKLLRLASEDSGINETIFAHADEDTRKRLLYKVSRAVYDGVDIPPESGNFLTDRALFAHQAKVLRKLLEQESYVCVGRAADFVLQDQPRVVSVFLDAPYADRIQREVTRQGITEAEAKRYVDRLDKYRNSYYNYHTGKKWKDLSNYDLCLDTAALGLDNCVALIEEYISLRFGVAKPAGRAAE